MSHTRRLFENKRKTNLNFAHFVVTFLKNIIFVAQAIFFVLCLFIIIMDGRECFQIICKMYGWLYGGQDELLVLLTNKYCPNYDLSICNMVQNI